MKRFLALLLTLVLVGTMIPTSYARKTEAVELTAADYQKVDAVFDRIDDTEDVHEKRNASETQLADAAQAVVLASENYVEGSLVRNGNAFTWMTDEGIRCAYNPRMRDIQKNVAETGDDAVYNEPVSTRGGWPAGNQVYLIGPYYGYDSDFTDQYKNEAKDIAKAIGDTDGYTLYSGKSATVDKVAEAVSKGAVVIFDSHGTTDYENGYDYVSGATSSYLCLTSTTGLTSKDYDDGALYYSDGIYINGATIANHMQSDSPNGFVWMALCLGMATDTLCQPLREKGVEVVYGYSQSVSFDGDYLYEETFWDNMRKGATVAEAVADMKNTWGNWDWSTKIASYYGYNDGYSTISEARKDYVAFPIVVSDEDTHPGQRKGSFYGADSLQTVKSTYTLFSQYAITASSNDTSCGTVTVSGNTITATPREGYYAKDYTLLSGEALVSQDGNTFVIRAEADCAIQINFAPKEMTSIILIGVDVTVQSGYLGEPMTLPVAKAPKGCTFVGWTQEPLPQDTTIKPAYFTDSFVPTESSMLYALYSYVEAGSNTGTGDYVKVTETPEDWSGEYLIVYEAAGYIFNGNLAIYDMVNNYRSVTIQNNTISQPAGEGYSFTIEKFGMGYSIRGASGNYIGNPGNSNALVTDSMPMDNRISLDANGNVNIIGQGGAYLRFNNTAGQNRFRYYKSSTYQNQKPVALYVKDGTFGTVYYTSTGMLTCQHENAEVTGFVAATCTTPGYTGDTICPDCGEQIAVGQVTEQLHTNSGSICGVCGALDHPGNMNEDAMLSDADAVYLLRHVLFPSDFPIWRNGDITGDGFLTDADAVYLLRHVLFPGDFPIQ